MDRAIVQHVHWTAPDDHMLTTAAARLPSEIAYGALAFVWRIVSHCKIRYAKFAMLSTAVAGVRKH